MSEKGLEPSRITPYAPETYVSTNFTTPTKQLLFNFHNLCWFAVVKSALALLSQNVTFSHLLLGRVPHRRKCFILFSILKAYLCCKSLTLFDKTWYSVPFCSAEYHIATNVLFYTQYWKLICVVRVWRSLIKRDIQFSFARQSTTINVNTDIKFSILIHIS